MPGVYEITYRDGRKEEYFGLDLHYYVLSGKRLLAFQPGPVWCRTCKTITDGELLNSKTDVEEELRQIGDPNSDWYRKRRRPATPEDISFLREYLNDLLLLWAERKAAPKCLRCFQPTVTQFIWNKWMPHPGTGEEILFQGVGICSKAVTPMRFFTPDCEEVSLSEKERDELVEMVRRGEIL